MRTHNKAFTLIELLVVIAIIAILAAILFPVFAQARAKARQVVCMSNEKQIATAMLMYAQDSDERWVDAYPNYNANDTGQSYYDIYDAPYQPLWIVPRNIPYPNSGHTYQNFNGKAYMSDYLLKPYVKNDNVQSCPTLAYKTVKYLNGTTERANYPAYAMNELWFDGDQSPFATPPTPAHPNPAYNDPAYSPPDYTVDNNGNQHWRFTGTGGRMTAQLWQPASLITIWEHNRAACYCNTWSPSDPVHWDASHHGGFNAAFADGHVKRMTLGTMRNQYVCYWQLPP